MIIKPNRNKAVYGASHPPVFIDGHQLQGVEEQKYLGIMFDSTLQWGPQIYYICKFYYYYYWYKDSSYRHAVPVDPVLNTELTM